MSSKNACKGQRNSAAPDSKSNSKYSIEQDTHRPLEPLLDFPPDEGCFHTFRSRSDSDDRKEELHLYPVVVDFRQLLKNKSSAQAIMGIDNIALLHAVVALYDVSLAEMTPDVLYSAVGEKLSHTIVLVRSVEDALASMEARRARHTTSANSTGDCSHNPEPLAHPVPLSSQKVSLQPNDNISHARASRDVSSLQNRHKESLTADSTHGGMNRGDPCDSVDGGAVGEAVEGRKEGGKQGEDVYEAEEGQPPTFAGVFSDDELSADSSEGEGSGEDEGEEEDWSRGIGAFLCAARDRRAERVALPPHALTPRHVAVENRLVAAATFKKTFVKPLDRVVHLTVIAVRRRYRSYNIGSFLLQLVKDMSVVGRYDAVVVHADNSAIEFFRKADFTDDLVINSRWSELAEQYTQCVLMTYLPPFTCEALAQISIFSLSLMGDSSGRYIPAQLDLAAMDADIEKWRGKSGEAYRAQASLIHRLRHEVVGLRHIVQSQREELDKSSANQEKLRADKLRLECEVHEYRLQAMKAGVFLDRPTLGTFDKTFSALETGCKQQQQQQQLLQQ